LGADKSRVNIQVYVVLGKFNLAVKPGDEVKFKEDLGLTSDFEMRTDNKCNTNGAYRKYWSDGCAIPKAVMETPDGKLIENHKYEESNPDQVMADLKQLLGLKSKEKK
jgi:hypothetical protein